MYSIGIDAHKRYSQITIMQENGKIINRCKVNNDRKSIKRALSPYAQDGSKAVLESGWNWGLLYDMVSDGDLEVKVAHPLKVKAIAEDKIKTDKISADISAPFNLFYHVSSNPRKPYLFTDLFYFTDQLFFFYIFHTVLTSFKISA